MSRHANNGELPGVAFLESVKGWFVQSLRIEEYEMDKYDGWPFFTAEEWRVIWMLRRLSQDDRRRMIHLIEAWLRP